MSNIIDTIQVSGVTYTIAGSGGGSGNSVVEVTQAQYDAMVSGGTVDPTILYIITDAQAGDLTQYWTSAQTQSAITEAISGKVDTSSVVSSVTSASTDSEIPTAKAVWDVASQGGGGGGGGGSSYSAGTNISIDNDYINCTLPIREGSNSNGKGIIVGDSECTASGLYGISLGHSSDANGAYSFCNGSNSQANGQMSFAYGSGCNAAHDQTLMFGWQNISTKSDQYSFGRNVKPKNQLEFGFGTCNNSSSASTTFGHSGNTLFSVGNGYDFSSTHNWHNAFEVRQNGDIYIADTNDTSVTGDKAYSLYPMIKLQDALSMSGYVTTDTAQNITGEKTFVGEKKLKFKQSVNSSKIGFTLYNSASTNNELATFEFRPNTYTVSNVNHPLLYLGHYRTTNIAGAGVPQTVVGFRQYDQANSAAYHLFAPLPEEAKTPFSLTTSFQNYFIPLGFKNGSTMIKTDNTGVADFSNVLGGLKLVKLTQSAYDALSPNYDSNTLYVIVN